MLHGRRRFQWKRGLQKTGGDIKVQNEARRMIRKGIGCHPTLDRNGIGFVCETNLLRICVGSTGRITTTNRMTGKRTWRKSR